MFDMLFHLANDVMTHQYRAILKAGARSFLQLLHLMQGPKDLGHLLLSQAH